MVGMPVGATMNSWKLRRLAAWAPPLIMLKWGTGSRAGTPSCSLRYWCKGWPAWSASAQATAWETASSAFAPSRALLGVPSSSTMARSSSTRSATALAISVSTARQAAVTPRPPYREGSPSRRSTASCSPVEAPDGTWVIPTPPPRSVARAATVGRPRLSRICQAASWSMVNICRAPSGWGSVWMVAVAGDGVDDQHPPLAAGLPEPVPAAGPLGHQLGVLEAAVDPGKQDPVDHVVGNDSECPAGVLLGGDPQPSQDAAFEVRSGFHARGPVKGPVAAFHLGPGPSVPGAVVVVKKRGDRLQPGVRVGREWRRGLDGALQWAGEDRIQLGSGEEHGEPIGLDSSDLVQWRVDPAPQPPTGVELGAAMPDQVHRRDRSALARADHGGAPQVTAAACSLALRFEGTLGSPWRNRRLLDRVSAEVAPQIAQVRCR